jgi:thiol-disulfide isomerase/thioredoxin
MKCLSFIFFIVFVFSCSNQKKKQVTDIIIDGQLSNIPDGIIYLSNARHWKTPLDSAKVTGGHFVFNRKTDSTFTPFIAAIHYFADGSREKPVRLIFRNHALGADSIKYTRDVFFCEKGLTRISGNNTAPLYCRIFAGTETELMFARQFTDFGWTGNGDTAARRLKIEDIKKQIRQWPGTFFFLQSIDDVKEQYSKEELQELLALFSNSVQQSAAGKNMQQYLAMRPNAGEPYPDLLLRSADEKETHLFDTTAGVNMLVFWASWCNPCIKEIPLLKTIQKKYSVKGLHLVSISIDENKDQWQKAILRENISWPQFIVPVEKKEYIQTLFNFVSIPLVIFTDNKGKEIIRFADYDPENIINYEKVIGKFIKPQLSKS